MKTGLMTNDMAILQVNGRLRVVGAPLLVVFRTTTNPPSMTSSNEATDHGNNALKARQEIAPESAHHAGILEEGLILKEWKHLLPFEKCLQL
ncbi:hypothetical protein AVEN_221587-1 [Araneus ventricosus]|uniref:Uncharacterized protein n=1 Tax=Araneus ventricosus TaxID=182803 RepID=A0A4Y2PIH9_ARAVE|nr:hypothetical protein AVEN_221587-1 [Araneus ventricosus]